MNNENLCVLIQGTPVADARFIAAWLLMAAEAQQLWSQALKDEAFSDRIQDLTWGYIPDFEAAALDLLWEIQNHDFVLVRALNTDESGMGLWDVQFVLMVRLGFFEVVDHSYRMMVPKSLTLEKIRWSAVDLVKTKDDVDGLEIIQPELLLAPLKASDAERQRDELIALRDFEYTRRKSIIPLQ